MKLLKWIFIAVVTLCISVATTAQSTSSSNRFEFNADTQDPVVTLASVPVGFSLQSNEVDQGSIMVFTLGVNHNFPEYIPTSKNIKVKLNVTPVPTSDPEPIVVELSIAYHPNSTTGVFKDKDVKILQDIRFANVQIMEIKEDEIVVSDLQHNLFVDITSYPNTFIPITSAEPSVNAISRVYVDDCEGDMGATVDAYEISWGIVYGALEYQLEWTFVNDYDNEFNTYLSSSSALLKYDFKDNSTRISTTGTSFKIPNLFDHGYLLVRVRALGYANQSADGVVPGTWSISAENGQVSAISGSANKCILNEDVHEGNLNWQVTTTFAEEGKKKEVISYFDGGYRNRQTVTQINTDQKIIVGETIYDYQGRPVINVLPVPVTEPTTVCTEGNTTTPNRNTLDFKLDFNTVSGGTAINAEDFDIDLEGACEVTAPVLSDDSGASLYYSENNPDKVDEQAFVPNANGFPYTQVEYMPDNTGRIRRQSGVGSQFSLGNGLVPKHETKYLYGKPFQIELDRLFASEVGVSDHYKKNAVVDPNGQVSVSYMDQEGRVVATALVGEAPSNLEELSSLPEQETQLTVDMFNENINGVSISNMVVPTNSSIEFSSTFIVPYTTEYIFNYDLQVSKLNLECTPADICSHCVYDLEIHLKDACGEELWLQNGQPLIRTVGRLVDNNGTYTFKTNCIDPSTSASGSLTVTLEQGTYQISKVLRINEEARTFYLEQYLNENANGCMTSLAELISEEAGNYDPDDCDIDCESCLADLGTVDEFVAAGFGTQEDWDNAYAICAEMCEFYEPCEAPYNMMCFDMSPGGQYGTYTVSYNTDGTALYSSTNDLGHRLSILNEENLLSANRQSYGVANWHLPVLHTTEGEVNEYRDENNARSRIYVTQNSDGTYNPAVVDGNLIFEDLIGNQIIDPGLEPEISEEADVEILAKYTFPENLANLGDFIQNWNPGWSKSLIQYHPEYCYYENCLELDPSVASNQWSSAKFDSLMISDLTRADAMSTSLKFKLLSSSGDVLNWFNVSTTEAYDEFVTGSTNYLGYGTVLQQKFDQYYYTGTAWWSMPQMAAYMARGNGQMGPGTVLSPQLYDFGGYMAGLSSQELEDVKDSEWEILKSLYYNLKQQLILDFMDEDAMTCEDCYCFNRCIGKEAWFPYTYMPFWNPSAIQDCKYMEPDQQCGSQLKNLYSSKLPRWPRVEDIPGASSDVDMNSAEYTVYEQTGLCPIDFQFQNLLGDIATTDDLNNTTGVEMQSFASFSPLYMAMNDNFPTTPLSDMDWKWKATSDQSFLQVNITDISDASLICEVTLDKGANTWSWDDVIQFTELEYTGDNGTDYAFEIRANVVLDEATNDLQWFTVQGSTSCFALANCHFDDQCEVNQIGMDIQELFNIAQSSLAGGVLYSGTSNIDPTYTANLGVGISNALNSPSMFNWQYDGGNAFRIGATSNSQPYILLDITSIEPATYTISDLVNADYFLNLNSEHEHYFSIEVYDNGTHVATLLGSGTLHPSGYELEPLPLGNCGAPQSLYCQGINYEMTEDLRFWIEDIMTSGPSQDPLHSLDISELIVGQISNASDIVNGNSGTIELDSVLYDTFEYNFENCALTFYSVQSNAIDWSQISSLGNFTPQSPTNALGQFLGFSCTATMIDGSEIAISGEGCWPMMKCDVPCEDGILDMSEIFELENTVEENSVEKYLAYIQGVEDFNLKFLFSPTDEGYLFAKSYEDFFDLGSKETVDLYLKKLEAYDPLIDDPELISDIEIFAKGYGNGLDALKEYYRYLEIVVNYDVNALANGFPYIDPIIEEDFLNLSLADFVDSYQKYLDTYSNPLQEPIDIYTWSELYESDIEVYFKQLYEEYVFAMKEWIDYQATYLYCPSYQNERIYSIETFVELGYSKDYESIAMFEDFIFDISISSDCLGSLKRLQEDQASLLAKTDSKVCQEQYLKYLLNLSDYNQSSYGSQQGYSLLPVAHNFAEFEALGYCDCVGDYLLYISGYHGLRAGDPSPPPVSLANFGDCGQSWETNPCDSAYTQYIDLIKWYNAYAVEMRIPQIRTIIDKKEFAAEELCLCLDEYEAYLQSIVDEVVKLDGYPLPLEKFCKNDPPCDPDISFFGDFSEPPYIDYINPCEEGQASLIAGNANLAYEQQITQMTQDFVQAYNDHCLHQINENLLATFDDKEYHYTLYYYDQAGNLVKTVPPAGVERKNISSVANPEYQQILADRENKTQTVFTSHKLATTYVYNSLNQLVRQNLPDHDPMSIENYRLPIGLPENFVSTEVQFVSDNLGYLSGYVGERGYLMRTLDGGNTWQRVENVVGADMEEIAWLDQTHGATVGAFGTILMTEDGGITWQQQDTHGVSYEDLLDVIATTDLNKPYVAVGKKGRIVYYHSTTSTWLAAVTVNILPTSTITSIAQLGSEYFITATDVEGTLGYTTVFKSTDLSAWTTVDVRTNSINSIGYLNADPVLFCGNDGQIWMARGNTSTTSTPNDVSPYISTHTGRKDNIYGCFYADLYHGLILAGPTATSARLYSTEDGGQNWQLMNASESYKQLVPYVESAGPVNKVLAYTNSGKLHRLTFNGGWGLVIVNGGNDGVAIKSIGVHHVYSTTNNSARPAMMSQGSQLYYAADASATPINWEVVPNGQIAKSIAVKYIGTSTLQMGGMLVSETNGQLYRITKTGINGSQPIVSSTNLTSETGYEKTVIDYDAATTTIYAVKANGDVKGWTMSSNGNILLYTTQAAPAGFGTLSSIAVVSGKIYLTATNGGIWQGTPSPNSISWTEKTKSLKPQPMFAIRSNGPDMLMAGADGDVFKWNSTASVFERLASETTKSINDIDWFNTSTYYMVADEGRLYKVNSNSPVAASIGVNGSQGTNLRAIDIKDGKYYITGANGKIWFKSNASDNTSPQALPQVGSGTPLQGVSFIPGSQQAIAVGQNTAMFRLSSTNKFIVHEIYGHPLEHVHFQNDESGYAVGHHGTVRYTINGGTRWNIQTVANSSQVETIYGVYTSDAGKAYVVGDKSYFAKAENATVVEPIPASVNIAANSILYDVVADASGKVIAVGASPTDQRVIIHSTSFGANYTAMIAAGNGLKGMTKLNHGAHAMAVGSQGKMAYLYFDASNQFHANSITTNISSSTALTDIDFTDDITCVVTGTGGLFKAKLIMGEDANSAFFISYSSGVAVGSYVGLNSLSFAPLNPAEDPLNGQNTLSSFNMQTVAMNGPYTGFFGSTYSSANETSCRLINDMSGKFSTLFYYDKLGRIVLSQNSKQQGDLEDSENVEYYSYTIYDALGRVSEAGQKEAIADGPQVESIYGAFVGGAFNPLTIETIDPDLTTLCNWNAWLENGEANNINPSRTQVTRTQYDVVNDMTVTAGTALDNFDQKNLRKRVASVYYQEVYSPELTFDNYDHATHYSYDIHGNVNVLLQDNPKANNDELGNTIANLESHRFKMMEYDYDLISGNVHSVSYQRGKSDAWHHAYKYDADNRITEVFTSTHADPMAVLGETESDPVAVKELWDNDAKYFYYDHGPLARVELGDNQVQGVDYAYTLQGWLKGINSNALSAERDMGKDGNQILPNANLYFGQDVASFSLGYFEGDYAAIESTASFLASTSGSTLQSNRKDLWNGNIGMMQTTLVAENQSRQNLGMAYKYDQLNRLIDARGFTDFVAGNNSWGTAASDGVYNNFFSYDANGNILTQKRWGHESFIVDDLTYHYAQNGGHITQNRLYNVNDAADETDEINSDMENQDPFVDGLGVNGNNNYIYSKIGELVSDAQEEIAEIVWRVDSKIKEVIRTTGSDKQNLKFDYDAMGNRVAKHVMDDAGLCVHSTYYVRDASGNVMAVYERDSGCEEGLATYALTERHIYGSSRVGMNTTHVEYLNTQNTIEEDHSSRTLGHKQYEISNHLGNVLTVVSDMKRVMDTNTDGVVDGYMASIISVSDYSPFGVTLEGRSWSNDEYRFGFQAQEQDEEMWGGSVTYKYRVEDPRLGRFFSVDPLYAKYPYYSVYQFSGNRLIDMVELEGLEPASYDGCDDDATCTQETDECVENNCGDSGSDNSEVTTNFIVRLGNNLSTPKQLAEANPSYPTLIYSPTKSFYNTAVTMKADTWTEADNYIQFMGESKNQDDLFFGALYFKEKTSREESGLGIEAPSALEFTISKQKSFTSENSKFSLNLEAGAGGGLMLGVPRYLGTFKYDGSQYRVMGLTQSVYALGEVSVWNIDMFLCVTGTNWFLDERSNTPVGDQPREYYFSLGLKGGFGINLNF